MNKYTYYHVIQEYYAGSGWCDVDFHETNSTYFAKDRKAFKENLRLYRENSQAAIRVINRKEIN